MTTMATIYRNAGTLAFPAYKQLMFCTQGNMFNYLQCL